MRLMHDPIKLAIAQKIHASIGSLGGPLEISLQDLYDSLVEPPNLSLGDLAFGCFPLAKALKKAPAHIATQLQGLLPVDEVIEKTAAAGPYLNFTLKLSALGVHLLEPILQAQYFSRSLTTQTPRTMIEYCQPNTHKELHVGHMRNLCLGNAIVRMLKYSGYEVVTATFPGDVGTHVAKCLWYMKYHNTEPVPAEGRGEWLGRMYSQGSIKLEDELGTPQEPVNREKLTEILHQLEGKSGEFYDLWKETREWSIALMKHAYDWADVAFDYWIWESDVDSPSVRWVKQLFDEGKLVRSEGAIGLDLSEDGLGFCLLLKSDGTGLYATKDLELARRKFQDQKIEKSIYVVDTRQALHFKQVFKALEKLGFEQAKDCFHLQYNFVELPDGAMSSRKGNVVPLMQLVERMQTMVKEQYLSRYEEGPEADFSKNIWTAEEKSLVAHQVAQGAIKYGMVRMDNNKKIVFDMNEWLKLDGESGPFIQYSYARIASLCRKLNFRAEDKVNWTLLASEYERGLAVLLMQFNTVVLGAAEGYRPASLCGYLFDLSKRFNLFYHECPIGTAENRELRLARLALAYACGETLKRGLGLLGVPVPNRM